MNEIRWISGMWENLTKMANGAQAKSPRRIQAAGRVVSGRQAASAVPVDGRRAWGA